VYRVLLYYKYVTNQNPVEFAQNHLEFCQKLGLKGRILIAPEGINGTCSGTYENTEQYMKYMNSDSLFADMDFKIDEVSGHVFKKMHVRFKKELVTLRFEDKIDPNESAEHLYP
jgi:UPF0176 protein